MKLQFDIIKQDQEIIIREYTELNKEIHTLLCEERYPLEDVTAAEGNIDQLIRLIRTPSLYPPYYNATRIAEALVALLEQDDGQETSVFFDDLESIVREREEIEEEELEEAEADIDELLDEDADSELGDDIEIKNLNSSIQIADDDVVDGGEG